MKISAVYSRLGGAVALLFVSAILFAGCLGRKHVVSNYEFARETQGAKLPLFLGGPAAALLTNDNGFSARVTSNRPMARIKSPAFSGLLLVRGSRMVFAPKEGDRYFHLGCAGAHGFYFERGVARLRPDCFGHPYHPNFRHVGNGPGRRVSKSTDIRAMKRKWRFTTDDGATANFGVWRASDLNGFSDPHPHLEIADALHAQPGGDSVGRFGAETIPTAGRFSPNIRPATRWWGNCLRGNRSQKSITTSATWNRVRGCSIVIEGSPKRRRRGIFVERKFRRF